MIHAQMGMLIGILASEFCSKHIVHTVCKCKMDFQPQRTRHVCMVVSQTTIFLDVGMC